MPFTRTRQFKTRALPVRRRWGGRRPVTQTYAPVPPLQGHDDERGWTLVIERATGALSAALADVEGGFVLTGACLAC